MWEPMERDRRMYPTRCLLLLLCLLLPAFARGAPEAIVLGSTTSTENSGLLATLLPRFQERTGIEVRVVARGTGQAMRMGERGDADVLLVHHRPSELRFVAEGYGVRRHDVMVNDFILVGPQADPAGIRGLQDAAEALRRIAANRAPFASRGDNSGTHLAELALWRAAGIDPVPSSGRWYRETGSGMGATLNTAVGMNAYALADRGTWLAFRNRGELVLLTQGDPRLFNAYSVILVNPARHPHVKAAAGQAFIDWLIGPEGQRLIADFRVNGEPLFFPNADGAVQPPADSWKQAQLQWRSVNVGRCPTPRQEPLALGTR